MSLVIDKNAPGSRRFSSVPVGDLFHDSEGDDCIKVDPSGFSYEGDEETLYPNTLRLRDSQLFHTPGEDWVNLYPDGTTITYEEEDQ